MRTCRHCEVKFDEAEHPPPCPKRSRSLPCEGKARGFASLSKDRLSAIASKGGKCAHAAGTAHKFSHEEATSAGKTGGDAPHERRGPRRKAEQHETSVSLNDRDHRDLRDASSQKRVGT